MDFRARGHGDIWAKSGQCLRNKKPSTAWQSWCRIPPQLASGSPCGANPAAGSGRHALSWCPIPYFVFEEMPGPHAAAAVEHARPTVRRRRGPPACNVDSAKIDANERTVPLRRDGPPALWGGAVFMLALCYYVPGVRRSVAGGDSGAPCKRPPAKLTALRALTTDRSDSCWFAM